MTLVRILREMIRNNDAEVVVGRDWADIVLKNGVYADYGFTNEQLVNDFTKLVKQYKVKEDSLSDFSADGTYEIGRKTVDIYHEYPWR